MLGVNCGDSGRSGGGGGAKVGAGRGGGTTDRRRDPLWRVKKEPLPREFEVLLVLALYTDELDSRFEEVDGPETTL